MERSRCQMKIKNYLVIVEEVNRLQFEVEASSEAEAIDLVETGEAGDPNDQRSMEFNCLSVKEYIK